MASHPHRKHRRRNHAGSVYAAEGPVPSIVERLELRLLLSTSTVHVSPSLGASAATQPITYVPINLMPQSYTQDMVVEAGAVNDPTTHYLSNVTASMDGGINKTGDTWYERGLNTAAPTTGLPPAGIVMLAQDDPATAFVLQPYTGNNAVMLDAQHSTAALTLAAPAAYSSLRFITSSGNANGTAKPQVSVTIHFADGAPDATGSFSSPDWFQNTPIAFTANGRVAPQTGMFFNVNSNNPRLLMETVPVADIADPIASIDLKWTGQSQNTHTAIFALSGSGMSPVGTQAAHLTVGDVSGIYGAGGGVALTATLTDAASPAMNLSGQLVQFSIAGQFVGGAITDASGKATLNSPLPIGVLTGQLANGVIASFAGDATYAPVSANANLTVSPADTTVTVDNAFSGQGPVTLTARIAAKAPSIAIVNEGTVTFTILDSQNDIVKTIANAPVSGGNAQAGFLLSSLPSGIYFVDASYSDSATPANFHPSTAATPGKIVPLPITYTVNNLNDSGSGSLRDAIGQADAHFGPDVVQFAPGLSGTISLGDNVLEVSDDLTIDGPGANMLTVQGDGANPVFQVDAKVIGRIDGLTISGGQATADQGGGGIVNLGTVAVTNCNITNNGAAKNGGGIFSSGTLTLVNSTVSNNGSLAKGGGIYNTGTLTLVNSTIFGNSAANSGSGGIENDGTLNVADSTISNNSAGGLANADKATAVLTNTIVAGNDSDISGSVDAVQSRSNLIGTGGSGGLKDGVNGNKVGVADPMLAGLGDFGGPVPTDALLPGSPALDAGDASLLPKDLLDLNGNGNTSEPLPVDQRGLPRVSGAALDIGAYEHQTQVVVNTLSDEVDRTDQMLSLREAVAFSAPDPIGTTIRFDQSMEGGTIVLNSTLVLGTRIINPFAARPLQGAAALPDPVTIAGLGANQLTVSGSNAVRVFQVFGNATATISGLTITGGLAPASDVSGGGIENQGNLTLANCIVTGNLSVGDGAGIFNGGFLTISNSTISANSAFGSGGGIINFGTLALTSSTVSGNRAFGDGAGINNVAGQLTVTNCTIAGNSGFGTGGGINDNVGMVLADSTVANNRAAAGGGLGSGGGTVIVNSIIAANFRGTSSTLDDVSGSVDTFQSRSNLIGAGGSGGLKDGASGNQVGVADPKLAPLGNYGGPTQTMPPLPGSPAIDAGSNALAIGPDGKPLITDQRGYYRIFNGTVDIGAVEFGSSPLLPGDADGDGKVDFADLVILARNYGRTSGVTWSDGDFNGDGTVDFDDLVLLARHYSRPLL